MDNSFSIRSSCSSSGTYSGRRSSTCNSSKWWIIVLVLVVVVVEVAVIVVVPVIVCSGSRSSWFGTSCSSSGTCFTDKNYHSCSTLAAIHGT